MVRFPLRQRVFAAKLKITLPSRRPSGVLPKIGSGNPAALSPTMTHCVRSYCISQLDSHFLIQFILAQREVSVSQWFFFRFHLSLSFPAESIHTVMLMNSPLYEMLSYSHSYAETHVHF